MSQFEALPIEVPCMMRKSQALSLVLNFMKMSIKKYLSQNFQ